MTVSTSEPKVLVLVMGLWKSMSMSTMGAKDQLSPIAAPSAQAT